MGCPDKPRMRDSSKAIPHLTSPVKNSQGVWNPKRLATLRLSGRHTNGKILRTYFNCTNRGPPSRAAPVAGRLSTGKYRAGIRVSEVSSGGPLLAGRKDPLCRKTKPVAPMRSVEHHPQHRRKKRRLKDKISTFKLDFRLVHLPALVILSRLRVQTQVECMKCGRQHEGAFSS